MQTQEHLNTHEFNRGYKILFNTVFDNITSKCLFSPTQPEVFNSRSLRTVFDDGSYGPCCPLFMRGRATYIRRINSSSLIYTCLYTRRPPTFPAHCHVYGGDKNTHKPLSVLLTTWKARVRFELFEGALFVKRVCFLEFYCETFGGLKFNVCSVGIFRGEELNWGESL